jgi:apolipoprotein D and lipocalin family protein
LVNFKGAFLKTLFVTALIFLSIIAKAELSQPNSPLETVPFVDVSRYLGTWYQIARNPLFFEQGCVCSRQVLSGPNKAGQVDVYNSCNINSPDGILREIRGTATNEDSTSNAKFKVDFNLPNKGDYWIIGLEENYQFAVVSDPSRKSLYILSKTPTLDPALYQQALDQVKDKIDTSMLLTTMQSGCTYP